MANVQNVGIVPIQSAGVTTPASINAATAITVPTNAQRLKANSCGIIECTVVVEGTSNARYTMNGTTPTAAIGHLFVVPGSITIVGEEAIAAFRIIGIAAGDTITYWFSNRNLR